MYNTWSWYTCICCQET